MEYKEQKGKVIYSDGDAVEKEMLEIAEKYPEDASQDFIANDSRYTINNTFSSVRRNILNWYPFKEHAKILEVGAGMGAVTGLLCDVAEHVVCVEMNENRAAVIRARYPKRDNLTIITDDINDWASDEKFDYVVFIGVLEYADCFLTSGDPYVDFLKSVKRHLTTDGTLLFAIENRFGLKYWMGASEDHLGTPFSGINGYQGDKNTPRTFSNEELNGYLKKAGFEYSRFYSVLPDYKFPELIFSKEYKPDYMNLKKVSFTYAKNSLLTGNEKDLYKDIISNDVFPFFANSVLVEAKEKPLDEYHVLHVSAKGEAKKEYRVSTIIDSDGLVKKMPMHKDAVAHIENIVRNTEELGKRGVRVLPVQRENNCLVSKCYDGTSSQQVFCTALQDNNRECIHDLLTQLKDAYEKSSEKTADINDKYRDLLDADVNYGECLTNAYVDMTFYNAFSDDEGLLFYDQEWCFHKLPIHFCMYYAMKSAYYKADVKTEICFDELLEYVGIDQKEVPAYEKMEGQVWSEILLRQTDFYGEDGYCNRYDKENSLLEVKSKLENTLSDRNTEIEQKNAEIEQKNAAICCINGECEQLREKENILKNQLEEINNSHAYRLVKKIWKIEAVILPVGSRRRRLLGLALRTIRHPFHLRENFNRYKSYGQMVPEVSAEERFDKYEELVKEKVEEHGDLKSCETLQIPDFNSPLVSIVIPVFNQFDFTYHCIKSLIQNTNDVSYEVILADDCSNDLTTDITKVVSNLKVVKTESNKRFLRNCNNAAKESKGKYILFLNNDTEVQENWLKPLVDLMESDETVGVTGSKLIYVDGTLQEAGGIFWKDGSAWNYGNGQDASAPEFNYVKEADYISGAALMIRRDIWKELGGFDELFAPAYCEDADICFSVRKLGYKVVYQPLSVVMHFEGISNGRDLNSGVKQYQVENMKKFAEKWKDELVDHFDNGENVFLAKDRSWNKKHILVVDHYVPHYDKDAGGKCTYMYLKLFVKLGMKVTFIGDNFYKHEPYTTELNQMGIEVLYGNYYYNNWKEWLKNNLHYFDYIYLQRPHISVKYMDLVKKYARGKIFYFAHDLHHIREKREYEITGDESLLESAENWKKIEYDLFDKADVGHVVGSFEQEEMQKAFPDKPIRNIPLYIYEDILDDINKDFSKRKDLIYVGGFGHHPNVDAVVWFGKEIMPLINKELPDAKIHIVGSKPPEEVMELQSETFIVEGFVDDDTLEKMYRECKMAIVPLRYGAGVKGKVVEAAYFQIPLVTTSIGAEGLNPTLGNFVIEDEAKKIADSVIKLYHDDAKLKTMSDAGIKFIQSYFSAEQARKVMEQDL